MSDGIETSLQAISNEFYKLSLGITRNQQNINFGRLNDLLVGMLMRSSRGADLVYERLAALFYLSSAVMHITNIMI